MEGTKESAYDQQTAAFDARNKSRNGNWIRNENGNYISLPKEAVFGSFLEKTDYQRIEKYNSLVV